MPSDGAARSSLQPGLVAFLNRRLALYLALMTQEPDLLTGFAEVGASGCASVEEKECDAQLVWFTFVHSKSGDLRNGQAYHEAPLHVRVVMLRALEAPVGLPWQIMCSTARRAETSVAGGDAGAVAGGEPCGPLPNGAHLGVNIPYHLVEAAPHCLQPRSGAPLFWHIGLLDARMSYVGHWACWDGTLLCVGCRGDCVGQPGGKRACPRFPASGRPLPDPDSRWHEHGMGSRSWCGATQCWPRSRR